MKCQIFLISFLSWSQPIAADTYFVRVYINNNLLPKYQYVDPSKADVVVS